MVRPAPRHAECEMDFVSSIRRVLVGCTAAGLFFASGALGAAPQSSTPRIAWTAPQGCPAAATVRAAVEAMVGAPLSQGRASDVIAEGVVTGEPGAFALQARVETGSMSDEKIVTADTCATLADAYAVIVAFAVDPSAGARLLPPAPPLLENDPAARRRANEAPAIATGPATPAVVPRPSVHSRPSPLGIGPFVATAVGLLPFPAFGAGGRLSVDAGPRWEIAAAVWPDRPSSATVGAAASTSQTVGAVVGLFAVQPAVCGTLWRSAVAVCVGADVGSMHATGTAVPTVRSRASWWVAPTSSLAVRLRLAQFVDLLFRIDVGVPIFTPSFVLDNVGPTGSVEVYRPPPVFGVASVEPELRFFSTD